ncbi:MAG: nitrile hydratase subunit alpha [Gammaproteobacteria bacterium]|nr:nitrile hydratase subunit alpha [Gammaproteobacteria bacterium]
MTHDHDHHDHTHPHPNQPDLEDGALEYHQIMQMAVAELLIEKDIITPDELREQIEFMDSLSPARGAQLVARAWVDPQFKAALLEDSRAAGKSIGIDMGPIPILVMENTPERHNLIVCTLCSCYPRFLLGIPPDWYKSRQYRSRAVNEPRQVLAEFGTTVSDDVQIRVHDSTADMRYVVLPLRPEGTDGWNEEQLAETVTRDCLIGVSVPSITNAS